MLKSLRWSLFGSVLVGLVVCAGCATQVGPGVLQTQEKVREAKEHIETVAPMKDGYTSDFTLAQKELSTAEKYLQDNDIQDAYSAAVRSIEVSKQILKQFYLDTVTKAVAKLKTEIETTTQTDPDNPIKDFLPKLDEMLAYAEQIQAEQADVSLVIIRDYIAEAARMSESKDALIAEQLESDVSFDLGRYDLSLEGKIALDKIVGRIIVSIENNLKSYPDKTVTIKLTVSGYTDEAPFREGTNLVKQLTAGFETVVPTSGIERRRFLNQRLSELRTNTISVYLQHVIEQIEQTHGRVELEQQVIGRGEQLPPDIPPPHPMSDPRRRVCKIYSYVLAR